MKITVFSVASNAMGKIVTFNIRDCASDIFIILILELKLMVINPLLLIFYMTGAITGCSIIFFWEELDELLKEDEDILDEKLEDEFEVEIVELDELE